MTKVNYDRFASFDINECCDHFDSEKQSNWKKIGKFIVADGQEYVNVMETEFDFEDAGGQYEAFEAGVAPKVVLEATHMLALEFCNLADLRAHAIS
jgi:hypothetical protein